VQVLTATGALEQIHQRSYPLSGIDVQQMRSPGAQAIPLTRLPTGEMRMLALSRVYRTNPLVYACVHLLARGLSSIPVRTYTATGDGARRRVRSDLPPTGPGRPPAGMALDRLFRQPAPRVSRRKLIFRAMIDIAVFGNALQTFNWGNYGPNEVWPVPWRRVRVVTEDPMSILWWEAWGAGGSRLLDPNETVHITWGDDPESVIGVSPIESLQYTIALHNAIDRHLVSYYGNAARPSGILKLNQMPKGDDVERIREQFRQLYTAPEQSGNVIITSAEYQPIAEATGVPTLVELIRLSREEVFGVYGVDPPMVGIYDHAIKANIQETRGKYVRDTLGPWATLFEDEWWAQMISQNPLWDYHWSEFDLDERLRPDLLERAQAYANLGDTLTVNEKRRKENVPDLDFPEADTVWMGSGRIPLGYGTPTTTTDLTPDVQPEDAEVIPEEDPSDIDDEED
jgi:HK97 family phage portal protein